MLEFTCTSVTSLDAVHIIIPPLLLLVYESLTRHRMYRHPPATLTALLYDRLQPSNMITANPLPPIELPDHPARPTVTHL